MLGVRDLCRPERPAGGHAEYDVTLTLHYDQHSILPLEPVTFSMDSPPFGLATGHSSRPVGVEQSRLPKDLKSA